LRLLPNGLLTTAAQLAPGTRNMDRSKPIFAAACIVATLLIFLGYSIPWWWPGPADSSPLAETDGRVQLVLDEQDIGLVQQGEPLEVAFPVVNAGTEPLLIRQVPGVTSTAGSSLPTFTIEPGQTGEVVAQLLADDLLPRGRKHVHFLTSDASCPELWLTVRGNVVRQAAADSYEAAPWP
jgi:hypothetical protein